MTKPNYLFAKNRKVRFDEVLETNPSPVPGTYYKVPEGAFIDSISFKAYGYDRSSDIVNANGFLSSRSIIAGLPVIYPNDKLWLPPEDPETKPAPETISSDSDSEIGIRLNGKIYRGWTVNAMKRSIKDAADIFRFTAPFDPETPESVDLDPYTYYSADLFIGGQLYISGIAERWNPSLSESENNTTIECRSRGGVLIDCQSQNKSLNFRNQTLKQISDKLFSPFGIKSEFPDDYNNAIIPKSKRSITDTVMTYLAKIAKSQGFIVNGTVSGGIKFDRANTEGKPIMSLVQGQPPLTSNMSASFDGTQRFSDYKAISQSNGQPGIEVIEQDKSIPIYRPRIFEAKDASAGNIADAAKAEKSRALARSFRATIEVATWRDQNGDLIFENNIITLVAPRISIYSETRFLIEEVTPNKDTGKETATLSLVLPESYTLEFPEVFPWDRS